MKGKLAGLLISVLYVLSLFAGATAFEIHALTVKPFDEVNTPVPNTISVTGTETHTWTSDGSKVKTFYLPHGTYDVTVKKSGYTDFVYKNVVISDSTGAVTNIYYSLTAQPGTEPGNGGTEPGNGDTEPSEPASDALAITDVGYDDEVKPGQEVSFDVDVKNNAGYDAEDIQVTVTIKSIDDGDDIDATEDFSTLDDKDKETYTLKLTIPKDVDDKKYDFSVKVEWEDEDGNDYYNEKTYTNAIEVVKEKHDVQITSVSFLTSSVEAGKSNQVSVELLNAGKNDETVRIKLEIPDLKVSVMTAQFDLDKNDETTQYTQFNVPNDAKAGKYFAYVTVYFNNGASNNMEMLTLEVKSSAPVQTEEKVTVTPVVVTTQTETTGNGGLGGLGTTGMIASAVIALIVLAMLYREFSPQFLPKPTVIKAGRGGR